MKMRLSLEDEEARRAIYKKLSASAQRLDENVVKANALIAQARSYIERAVEDHNKALADAGSWCAKITEQTQQEVSSASGRWLKSGARQNYEAWARHFKEANFERIHVDFPDGIVLDIEDHPQLLADLPSRPSVAGVVKEV